MNAQTLTVLLVEDNDDDAELLKLALKDSGFAFERASRLSTALESLAAARFDAVLLDLTLPDAHGYGTFERLHAGAGPSAIVVLTGMEDEALGLRTVHEGAQDYLIKGKASPPILSRAIRYAVERKRLEDTAARYAEELRVKHAELQEDLQLAREVQQAFLPRRYPLFADRTLEFSHRYVPAGAVGGDYFDLFKVSDHEAGLLICDVMGHGVRAALVTAMLRALVAEELVFADRPEKLLQHLNSALRSSLNQTDSLLFVSAFYLVIDAHTGEARYANAGHPPPLWVRADGRSVQALSAGFERGGPALGFVAQPAYRAGICRLEPGDRLLLFTDGVFEVEGARGEVYGVERLHRAAWDRASLPRDEFLDGLLREVASFSASGGFTDDTCVVTVDFKPTPEGR